MHSLTALLFLGTLCIFVGQISSLKYCNRNDECNENECCISRRSTVDRRGICNEIPEEGELCNPNQEENEDHKYEFSCPCAAGLTCTKMGVKWGTTDYEVHECRT